MLTLGLGAAGGILVGAVVYFLTSGWVWTAACGIIGFFAVTIGLNLWVKKRLEAVFAEVQQMVEQTQAALRRKMHKMQNKLAGKGLQRQLEKQQAESMREALQVLDKINPLHKWSILAERQANTLRAQLHYQIKEFEEADRCFAKCLVLDPITMAMKMARQYRNDDKDALEKSYKRGIRKFKDDKATLIYALYTWILVKQERIDEAVAILDKAKDSTENEVLRANWEHLANGRVRRFANAGLGDQWYALHLETPKPVKIKQRMGRRR